MAPIEEHHQASANSTASSIPKKEDNISRENLKNVSVPTEQEIEMNIIPPP